MMEGLSVFQDSQRSPNVSIIPSAHWQIRDAVHRTCMSNIRKHCWKFATDSGSLNPLSDDLWHKAGRHTTTCPPWRCAQYVAKEDESPNYRCIVCLWVCVMQTIRSYCSLQWRALNLMVLSKRSTVKWITWSHVSLLCVCVFRVYICVCGSTVSSSS